MKQQPRYFHLFLLFSFLVLFCLTPKTVLAQDYVTGAFEGQVNDSVTGAPVPGAIVQIVNKETGVPVAKQTDSQGHFRQGLLAPGDYIIRVSKPGYANFEKEQPLPALRPTGVVPVPVKLIPEKAAVSTPGPTPEASVPSTTSSPNPTPTPAVASSSQGGGIAAEINLTDGQRGGMYPEKEVSTLPLGATTLTRSFDELGLLLPGVALPPQTQGSVAGPGVGAGVGSAGQFAVNGLRSRSNNFTVDGSDNNDEDIGVRRQGFLALIPQPIESIKEFQMITLLAPAQYGRNVGAQVNAISKSGGNATHGTVFGFFNSSQLNAREFFDTANGTGALRLTAGNNQPVLNCGTLTVAACTAAASTRQITVQNRSAGKDSFTLGQGGFVIGGPMIPETREKPGRSLFYFVSMEGHILNAAKEESFAVPTVAQRGLFGSGASGLTFTPFTDVNGIFPVNSPNFFFPTTTTGDFLFSYFPFPNNPNGVYGANTLTQVLPASGQSKIASAKVNGNFHIAGKQQSITARYNFTQDWRDIPATGGAIFSSVRPRVRTQNFSTFLNSDLSGANSSSPMYNQLRLSYGRTRLNFDPVPDGTGFLIPSNLSGLASALRFNEPDAGRFLLNAPVLQNFTLPNTAPISPNLGPVIYRPGAFADGSSTDNLLSGLGPIGQVSIAGFSPVGVDVFNFPQKRVDNTYQLADTVTWQRGVHSFAFGTDIRRTELNSDLPRNGRPIITVNGAPRLTGTPIVPGNPGAGFKDLRLGNTFISAVDLAAAGVTSGFYQTLSTNGTSHINLRYYQFDFFGQDEWRIRRNFSLSYGVRYEYNTPPRELNRRIESTFTSPALSLVNLAPFLAGRTQIFDPDRNNIAPRVSFAYSPNPGSQKTRVIRAGYGLFYDQILGAVVSQSRNVFPNFLTANFAGGGFGNIFGNLSNPFCPCVFQVNGNLPLSQSALGAIAPGLTLQQAIQQIGTATGRGAGTFGATLPARNLKTPMAHQYSATFEQQLTRDTVASVAYVGTLGRNLTRYTTPNLGPNELILPLAVDALSFTPTIYGFAIAPGVRVSTGGVITGGRPTSNVGVVNIYEDTANSRYDALQAQVRGRLKFLGSTQYQVSYTFSRSNDDASDVFDLAGSPALPQDSLTLGGEYAPSNFDARHRISYNYISDPPRFKNKALQAIFGDLQWAGTGQFQTGQPFTVNSINDVNLDGNLTDRLNTTSGIVETGDRSQPLRLTANPATLLAPVGQDGAVPRNSFRTGSLWLTNTSLIKTIHFSEQYKVIFRTEVVNLFNRANFGVPVRFLEFPNFGKATSTVTPGRRIQFGLKFVF